MQAESNKYTRREKHQTCYNMQKVWILDQNSKWIWPKKQKIKTNGSKNWQKRNKIEDP